MPDGNTEGTVLLIDDEPDFLKVASWRLEREGHLVVLTSTDSEAGLDMAKTSHPDVILLDLMMPKLNGHEVLQRLRGDPKTHDIPVIMLTSVGTEDKMAVSLSLGAVAHLTKPYDAKELLREVKLAIARHREGHKNA